MSRTPTREEVIKHFKDAEEVKGQFKTFKITDDVLETIKIDNSGVWLTDSNGWKSLIWANNVKKYIVKITKRKTKQANHYGERPDVIDFAYKYNLSFPLANAVKYIARAGKKQGEPIEKDLNKAIDCIKRELERHV